jgi:NitT/TauT family transport system substrate-binding protein
MRIVIGSSRRIAVALLVCTLALVPAARGTAQTNKLVSIKVIATADDAITPILYAIKAKMFEQAGLDVQLQKGTGGAAVTAAVVSGSYDIGHASLIALMNAHVRNVPAVVIAPGALFDTKTPYAALLVPKDSVVTSGKDLDGKIVASATLGDLAQVALCSWSELHGGDWHSMKFVEVPMSAAGTALIAHRTSAQSVTEPFLDSALATNQVRSLGSAYAAIAPHFLFSGWFTTTDWAKQHPDLVKKFAQVINQAGDYTNAHHAETAPILGQFSGVPAEVFDHMSQRAFAGTKLRAEDIQPLIDRAARYSIIPHAFPAKEMIESGGDS